MSARNTDGDWISTGVASVISVRRRELKLSQEELGRRCGLHRSYISDIERGARSISLRNFGRIADALQMSPSLMFRLIEKSTSN